jgi:glucose/arabinose dehydrogenase
MMLLPLLPAGPFSVVGFGRIFSRLCVLAAVALLGACRKDDEEQAASSPAVQVAKGYTFEKVVDGLSFPTSVAWDDNRNLYVVEAGGGFLPEPAPARVLRVTPGGATEVVNLTARGVTAPVGFTYLGGSFYISHRAADGTGAVSRILANGATITQILGGFLDSGSEHPLNDIRAGPDGRLYLGLPAPPATRP